MDAQQTAQNWAKVRELFDELIEREAGQRETILAGLRLDPSVLRETRELLAAADRSAGFMTVLPNIEVTPEIVYRSLAVDSRVGVFAVEAIVGRGGHGEVYRASRQDGQFEQQVALKLLRPEALSQFENFRAERQILASLEHAGIARLIDGGIAPDGRPYMAMEFIEGTAIDAYCRSHRLDLEARIGLMLAVCAAVAHAHANLVVHGDIKPDNILVTADGQPKLLDFGIARLLETGQATSGLTVALSTPAYAAPEQLAGKRATIATDVYALGALLYEVLSGSAAWQLGDAPVSWASRILNDEPPLPSVVARHGDADGIDPALLRGDLDAIVGKAMRAQPGARYETVPALMDDLRRFVDRRPVLARNGNAAYRVGRFVRRNAIAVAASGIIAVVALGGAAGIGWNMQRAEANRVAAQLEAIRGESMRDFMAVLFRAVYAEREEGLHTARDILDAGAAQLERDAMAGPVNAQLVRTIGELYFEVEEYAAAQPILENFLKLAGEQGDGALVAQVKRLLASIALRQGDVPGTERLIAEADAFFSQDRMLYARERAELDGVRAALLRETGHRDEAIALLRRVVAELTGLLGPTSLDVLTLQQNLAVHLLTNGQREEAEEVLTGLRQTLRATGREQSSIALAAVSAQGQIDVQNGNPESALALFGEAVAIRKQIYAPSGSLLALDLNYARGLADAGRNQEALAVYDEAIGMVVPTGNENGTFHVVLLANRGLAQVALGHLDAAAADIDQALIRSAASFGRDSQYYGLSLFARAQLHYARGDMAAAQADLERSRPLFEAMGPGAAQYLAMHEQVQAMVAEAMPK